ncbi:hypothetical protein IQ250_03185 [Pseudanabaenaceae cyanobacterium LEGE 13415]|nr:hypothetical protein [Pseudanabaenaceae cyanobacterium LEGE 13415]
MPLEDKNITTNVQPEKSPPPEGIVMPKLPPSFPLVAFLIVGTALIVFACVFYYYEVAQ